MSTVLSIGKSAAQTSASRAQVRKFLASRAVPYELQQRVRQQIDADFAMDGAPFNGALFNGVPGMMGMMRTRARWPRLRLRRPVGRGLRRPDFPVDVRGELAPVRRRSAEKKAPTHPQKYPSILQRVNTSSDPKCAILLRILSADELPMYTRCLAHRSRFGSRRRRGGCAPGGPAGAAEAGGSGGGCPGTRLAGSGWSGKARGVEWLQRCACLRRSLQKGARS